MRATSRLKAALSIARVGLEIARFLLRPPPLRELERVPAHPEHLPFWALINEGFQEDARIARLGRRLFRRLPRRAVYRLWIVPGFTLQLMLLIATAVRERGRKLREESGLSLVTQSELLVRQCLRHPGLMPEDFYVYGLHLPEREPYRRLSAHNVHIRAVIDLASLCGEPLDGRFSKLLYDKRSFRRICRANGLPVAELIATFSEGQLEWFHPESRLPERDLFLKPAIGTLGLGARRLFFDRERRGYVLEPPPDDPLGRRIPAAPARALGAEELVEHLRRISTVASFLLQPRLANHAALARLVGDATLSTLRVITVRERSGGCEVVGAFLRSSLKDVPIDSFTQGGVSCNVDLDTGRLGPAYTKMGQRPVLVHPRTGLPFEGFGLPFTAEALRLARAAHAVFGSADPRRVPVAGWDIAVTGEGPVLLEGNCPCALQFQKLLPGPLWAHQAFARGLRSHLEPVAGRQIHLHPALRRRVPAELS